METKKLDQDEMLRLENINLKIQNINLQRSILEKNHEVLTENYNKHQEELKTMRQELNEKYGGNIEKVLPDRTIVFEEKMIHSPPVDSEVSS